MHRKNGNIQAFAGKGFAKRELFDHSVVALAKPYPDSQLLLERRGLSRKLLQRGQFLQLNLYTNEFYDLPGELFTDPEVNWHGQQLGRKGLIAAAGLWVNDSTATVTTLQSDVCQQLYRHPELRKSCKTQIETHFRYWYAILFNAVLDFCLDFGIAVVNSPTGRQIVADTQRPIAADLFLRIYDYPERTYSCPKATHGRAEYWEIPVQANAERVARLRADDPATPSQKTPGPQICLFHDIEEDIDTSISPNECADNLTRMLEIEQAFNVNATYDILGTLFSCKSAEIHSSNSRHAIAFHSFNHNVKSQNQLRQCRNVDLRIKGYRPPQSIITSELTAYNLTFLNFEWFACSADSLGRDDCGLQNGIVWIPIHLDDYALFRGVKSYDQWESEILAAASSRSMLGIGLHDCYASTWLEHFPDLLEKLGDIGTFVSADDVCKTILEESEIDIALREFPTSGMSFLARSMQWLAS